MYIYTYINIYIYTYIIYVCVCVCICVCGYTEQECGLKKDTQTLLQFKQTNQDNSYTVSVQNVLLVIQHAISSHHHNTFMANGVLWQTNVVSSVEVVGVEIVFGTENHRRKVGNIHRDIKNYANLSYIFFCAKMPQYSHYKHCLQEDSPHFGL